MIACERDKSPERSPCSTEPVEGGFLEQNSHSRRGSACHSSQELAEFISNLNRLGSADREADLSEVDQLARKADQSRLKYRRLKQRLQSASYRHEELSLGRELPSSNKPRLMKLAIELERQVHNQVKDYSLIDNTLRELWKVLDQRRQADLHVLRQSRCMPSLMELFKRIVSSHKSEYRESVKLLDLAVRILHLFASVPLNREYLILTNRLQTILSLLNWTVSKRPHMACCKFITVLFSVATGLLDHRLESEATSIVNDTIEFALYSHLMRRVRQLLESEVAEELSMDEPLVKAALRFCSSLFQRLDPDVDRKSIGEFSPSISQNSIAIMEVTLASLCQFMSGLLFEPLSQVPRETHLPNAHISMLLHTLTIFSRCSKMCLALTQKVALAGDIWPSLLHLLLYCKNNYQSSKDTKDLLDLLIVVLGYLCFENAEIQTKLNHCKIVTELCNLPTNFIYDKRCVEVLMPTLCCLVYRHEQNFRSVFNELSPVHMQKFLRAELKQLPEEEPQGMHSRKLSQSSFNSQNTQCSALAFEQDFPSRYCLRLRFPVEHWRVLCSSLERIE